MPQPPHPLHHAGCIGKRLEGVLRACGKTFDVDRFLASSHGCTDAVYRDGEKRRIRAGGRDVCTRRGFNLRAPGSRTVGESLPDQAEAVPAFLLRERAGLERRWAFPGLDGSALDSGVSSVEEPCVLFLPLPAARVRAAGLPGIALAISIC